jgi:hypothetical protein
VDEAQEEMGVVQGKLAELLDSRDPSKVCTIIILGSFVVPLTLMAIYI